MPNRAFTRSARPSTASRCSKAPWPPSRRPRRRARGRGSDAAVEAHAGSRDQQGRTAVYVIIVGAGKVGRNLARELIAKGNEVTLIESSRPRYLAIEEEFEHAIQYGDATEL